jgi:3-phenylpropionate/trans-cinnamate dioxygenase ferredoxin reductase subunit
VTSTAVSPWEEEAHHPYTRQPLSKEVLQHGSDRPALALQEDSWYADNDINMVLGQPGTGLDTGAHSVKLAYGSSLDSDGRVLATWLVHRPLPRLDQLSNAHRLRTLDDAERLERTLVAGRHLVVGTGFVGLEVAASARSRGLDITVVDGSRRCLWAGPSGRSSGSGTGLCTSAPVWGC